MPQGSRQPGSFAHTNTKVLVLSTVLLYMTTGTYVAALLWNRWRAYRLVLGATNGGFSPLYDGYQEMAVFEDAVRKQSWMAVIALEVNVRVTPHATNIVHARPHLISLLCAVRHWGRDRVVARVRHLAEQGRVLRRAAPGGSHPRYVPPPQSSILVCSSRRRLISPLCSASLDTTSRKSSRRC